MPAPSSAPYLFVCKECDLTVQDALTLQRHLEGRKHKRGAQSMNANSASVPPVPTAAGDAEPPPKRRSAIPDSVPALSSVFSTALLPPLRERLPPLARLSGLVQFAFGDFLVQPTLVMMWDRASLPEGQKMQWASILLSGTNADYALQQVTAARHHLALASPSHLARLDIHLPESQLTALLRQMLFRFFVQDTPLRGHPALLLHAVQFCLQYDLSSKFLSLQNRTDKILEAHTLSSALIYQAMDPASPLHALYTPEPRRFASPASSSSIEHVSRGRSCSDSEADWLPPPAGGAFSRDILEALQRTAREDAFASSLFSKFRALSLSSDTGSSPASSGTGPAAASLFDDLDGSTVDDYNDDDGEEEPEDWDGY
jgi:hypothetical protein